MDNLNETQKAALFRYLLRWGDDALVNSQRLSEWCGHGPILEEDIALTNIALDQVGQAEGLLRLAGQVEDAGRSEDDLAYLRDEYEFFNCQLVEQPRGDFGDTIVRQFFYTAFTWLLWEELKQSAFEPLAHLAAKYHKEATYHLRHAREWVLRLGDGTEESRTRVQSSVDRYWEFTGELFYQDDVDDLLLEFNIAVDAKTLRTKWNDVVTQTLAEATLSKPQDPAFWPMLARKGQHSEHLGHMLATMQILARSHPGASW